MAGNGLRIRRSQGMEGFTANTAEFPIAPGNTNPIFFGDPVVLNAGNVEAAAVTAKALLGTFAGWRNGGNDDAGLLSNQVGQLGGRNIPFSYFWSGAAQPADTIPTAIINLPPHSMFQIYGDSTINWNTTKPVPGALHDFIINAGDTRTGDSRVALGAAATAGTGGSIQFHRLVPAPGNKLTNSTPLFEVTIVGQQGTASDAAANPA